MPKKPKTDSNITARTGLPWLLLIAGIVGVISSAILTAELINILRNPAYSPVCNLNPIFSCSLVTTSDQASAFGFSNEFLGLVGFAAVATVGAAMLAGARFARWFWQAFNAGLFFAVLFITWFQFESLYRLGSLCIFCAAVWAVTIPVFWYVTLFNLREGHIRTPASLKGSVAFVQRHHADILLAWYLLLLGLVLKRFWYYWSTLI